MNSPKTLKGTLDELSVEPRPPQSELCLLRIILRLKKPGMSSMDLVEILLSKSGLKVTPKRRKIDRKPKRWFSASEMLRRKKISPFTMHESFC